MTYETSSAGADCVLTISGDVDISCTQTLKLLERQLAQSERVVVDVGALRYADTTFLRFLLQLRKRESALDDGGLQLVGVRSQLRRVLEVTGLSRLFVTEPAA